MTDGHMLTVEVARDYLGVRNRTRGFKLVRGFEVPRYKRPLEEKRTYWPSANLDKLRQPVRVGPQERAA